MCLKLFHRFEVLGDNAELESAPSLGPKRARESKDFKLMQGYVAYCFPQFELFTSGSLLMIAVNILILLAMN